MVRNCMEQSHSWEANSHSANQEIPRLSWNMKVYCHVHNSLPSIPNLGHMHPVHTLTTYFPQIHSNIILPPTLRTSKLSLPFRFFYQNFVCISHLTHVCYMPHPCRSPWLDHPNNSWSVQLMKLLIMQPPVISSLLHPHILLSTQFSNTINLCSSLSMRNQVSHPYKTTGNIILLYTSIFNHSLSHLYEKTGKIIVLCVLIRKFLTGEQKTKVSKLNGSN